ncbi:glutathione S-transferase family protein [Diaphorobacter aerolatus]|uniref:Glutathione S-transferase family protein n=1 Tax=Diaphorobacter aerolatus TaxID=1288495 RepID=A0A7H0GJM2_9BURK|nr:glutathione S-transferase family protein [Diaphorobacter aerolatus]QNP48488.1 glutathione S-transferase family protein [Diaphorobacter aerolatus]
MNELILHHYPMSPFSHKIRAIMGYKQLAWKSVIVPGFMPKPDVEALTGGYRRTPYLQIGADIYCDTALICDVLEHHEPTPTLYPEHQKGLARVVAQWADEQMFWAAMSYNFQPQGLQVLFANADRSLAEAFVNDRKAMGFPLMAAADAAVNYRSDLRRIASMLDENKYLLGDQPCIADFSVFHPLWFTRIGTPNLAAIFDATPQVLGWMDRISALGVGRMEKLSMQEAMSVAAQAEPATIPEHEVFLDDHGIALGTKVAISAASFGMEPTVGKLVAATRTRYTLARVDARAGNMHVHFPRVGYVMRAV